MNGAGGLFPKEQHPPPFQIKAIGGNRSAIPQYNQLEERDDLDVSGGRASASMKQGGDSQALGEGPQLLQRHQDLRPGPPQDGDARQERR